MLRIANLIDDAQCYESVRQLRWPESVSCPWCKAAQRQKRGLRLRRRARQRYHCKACQRDFDDLTNSVCAHIAAITLVTRIFGISQPQAAG